MIATFEHSTLTLYLYLLICCCINSIFVGKVLHFHSSKRYICLNPHSNNNAHKSSTVYPTKLKPTGKKSTTNLILPPLSNFLAPRNTANSFPSVSVLRKLTSSVIYTNTNKKNLNENVIGSVLYNALNFAPTLSIFDDNGNYTLTPADGFGSEVINPMAQIDAASNNTEVNKIAPNIGLNYKFWENFSADAKFQYNYANVNTRTFNAINTFGESSTVFDNLNTNLSNYKVAYEDYIFDAYVNFEKNFNDIHDVKVLVGTSVSKATFYNKINIAGFDLVDGDLNSNILDAPRVEDYNVLGNAPDKIDGARL